jgi:ATP-dependent Clp protease ATP-binding subunit ClpC
MSNWEGITALVENQATAEARELGHGYLGVEHIFLAMLGIQNGVTTGALVGLGHDRQAVERLVREHVELGTGASTADLPLTPRAERVIQSARLLAERENVEPSERHLLLAILHDGENAVVRVIRELGLTPERLRDAVSQRQRGAPGMQRIQQDAEADVSVLDSGRDLTELARRGELHEAIGRQSELLQLAQILVRKTKNNPVLVGEAGVGKTAIVEGLACRIARGDVHPDLRGKRIVELTATSLVAGTTYRGQFEERMERLIQELRSQPDVIVFFDEVHTLLGAGVVSGSALDAAQILKPALARGEIRCIGATTLEEYRRFIEKDAALERRFQPIMVAEPSEETTLEILRGLKPKYEDFHKVRIPDELLQEAVRLGAKYLRDRHFPDKAVDILDQACSRAKLARLTYISGQDGRDATIEVPVEAAAEVVAQWTGRPVTELRQDELDRLLTLEDELRARVIGQDEAVSRVARAVRAACAGMRSKDRPRAVFLFLGPTGVGKTELVKELARILFGSRDAMIRLDMSEYMEKHSVSRLVGAPPGYIGHDEPGQLTDKLRTTPYCVVLIDEVEKAHPDVLNVFLQVFDDGRLTDSKGRTVDCTDAIFVMTSNLGSDLSSLYESGSESATNEALQSELLRQQLLTFFRPELLNRVDDIIVFRPLSREDIIAIARLMLAQVDSDLPIEGVSLHITEGAMDVIIDAGYDPIFGARPMRRAVDTLVRQPIAELILRERERISYGDVIVGIADGNQIVFRLVKPNQTYVEDTNEL